MFVHIHSSETSFVKISQRVLELLSRHDLHYKNLQRGIILYKNSMKLRFLFSAYLFDNDLYLYQVS